jgi:glycosyltransferase involved in cell wall biosynthesis
MQSVVIFQRVLPHYRISFYDALFQELETVGVRLKVVYGQEFHGTVPKSVDVNRSWAVKITNRYFNFLGREIVWQPALSFIKGADLIVVEQANRLLVNYLLLIARFFGILKLSFWGHGKNYQASSSNGILERFKRIVSTNVDWWFTYTQEGKDIVSSLGFKLGCITVTENSIDTKALKAHSLGLTDEKKYATKLDLKVQGENTVIYCGGMYGDKKIEFLIEACKLIKMSIPDYHIIFIGEGPDAHCVHKFSKENNWVHYLGALTGDARVPYFSISKVMLMPGLVGLAVLDSFALEVPMISTDIPIHSPEFSYLQDKYNGLITKHDVFVFSEAVADLLLDEPKRLALVDGCKVSSSKYTVENMARNFSEGIVACLKEGA